MYEIKVLTSDEFDNLPDSVTRGSDISDSLGFADQKTGKAYVRYSSYPALQSYLVNHELEELMADESTHEDENGIRHGKKGGFMRSLIPILATVGGSLIPGIGPIAGPLAGGITGSLMNKQKTQQPQQPLAAPSGMGQSFASSSPVQPVGPPSMFSGGINQPSQQGMGKSPLLQFGETDLEKNPYQYGAPLGRDPNRYNL